MNHKTNFSRKLSLNKRMIANLSKQEIGKIYGGVNTEACTAETCFPNPASNIAASCKNGTRQNETMCSRAYNGPNCTRGSECGQSVFQQ